jgi:hypothetical protein
MGEKSEKMGVRRFGYVDAFSRFLAPVERTNMKSNKQPKDKKLPSIWWHEGANQFACKIGFRIYSCPNGRVRDRCFQLLGPNYEEAVRKCLALAKDWRWTVEFFKISRKGDKPVWLEERMMRGYQAAHLILGFSQTP